ncbi:hypothetical protein ACFL5O_01140 [Myxococcota bacterium]
MKTPSPCVAGPLSVVGAAAAILTAADWVSAQQVQAQVQGQVAPGARGYAAEGAGTSDHDAVVGRFALGYLGRRSMLVGAGLAAETEGAAEQAVNTAHAPIIGLRYWFTPMVGLDAGAGFSYEDGSSRTELTGDLDEDPPDAAVKDDLAGISTLMLHGGVPLALAGAGHFSFQVVPELNVGFASRRVDGAPDREDSGFHIDIGVRAGAEIHFGFIDIPQLSLQGSVGALYSLDSTKTEVGGSESTRTRGLLTTTVHDSPWYIFTSNVAALYYF